MFLRCIVSKVLRSDSKSVAIDVCIEFWDSENNCQELTFNVSISHLNVTNEFAGKNENGLFSCKKTAQSPFKKHLLEWRLVCAYHNM